MNTLDLISPSGLQCCFSTDEDFHYLFFHSIEHSMQWGLNEVGVMVVPREDSFQIKLLSTNNKGSHSFSFYGKEELKKTIEFFRALRFPVSEIQMPRLE